MEFQFQPPTSFLPSIRQIASLETQDLAKALYYLRHIYVPEVRGSRRSRPNMRHPAHLAAPNIHARLGLDDLRSDAFERSYAIRWLTAVVAQADRWNEDSGTPLDKDHIIEDAASLLAICSGTAAAGIVARDFVFEYGSENGQMLGVHVKDVPLDNHDYGSVGAQTWGGACVLAETILNDPASFGLVYDHAKELRVLELGAGTGLVSLVLGKLLAELNKSATIIATDYYPLVLENLRSNIEYNFHSSPISGLNSSVNITSHPLDWSSFSHSENDGSPLHSSFDLVLGADIVYEAQHAIWIKSCLQRLLRKPSFAIDPLFHLMIPLRSTHSFESGTIDEVFANQIGGPSGREADLTVISKEIILCDAGSGMGSDQVEYAYYKIGWR